MATSFSRTLRALNDDAPRHIRGVAIALALLGGWIVWALAGRVSIVAVSQRARFESRAAVRQIAIPLSGRITRVNIALGQRVRRGDVLLELDAADATIRRGKAVADIGNLRRRIDGVTAQIAATRAQAAAQVNAAAAKLQQARESRTEAAHLATIESTRADRLEGLARQGLVPATDATEARSRADAARARGRGLAAAEEEAAKQQAEAASTAEVALRALDSDRIELQTQLDAEQAALQQAEVDIDRQRVRAPSDGRIGSSAELREGTWVEEGTVAASIVPDAAREVAAWFALDDMPLVRPGQSASVWLESLGRGGRRRFTATVTGIERDTSGSDFRVTLRLTAPPPQNAAIDQGFPATVTIDVQRLSPFDALLRAAGMLPAAKPAP
ncbi:MAG TPA: HlyD family efflux transporter periplasmic adaptor subunit [Thermoanaerobaculia bacterium]|nr:HlyD family efflux transporter periplasmic adaptor subunit [Thermoanaerobaculia bacterium]